MNCNEAQVSAYGNSKTQRWRCRLQYKWNLHGGKTTMLYLNLSGHDIFKKRFGTSPEKHCLTAMPYRLFFKETHEIDISITGHL